jgi:hypothetical protein
MEIEIYNKAKKIDKEIAELQDCKLLLMKGKHDLIYWKFDEKI